MGASTRSRRRQRDTPSEARPSVGQQVRSAWASLLDAESRHPRSCSLRPQITVCEFLSCWTIEVYFQTLQQHSALTVHRRMIVYVRVAYPQQVFDVNFDMWSSGR